MNTNCHLLMSMIKDILDFQQIKKGVLRLVPTTFSVKTLGLTIYNLFIEQAKMKNIEFIVNYNFN